MKSLTTAEIRSRMIRRTRNIARAGGCKYMKIQKISGTVQFSSPSKYGKKHSFKDNERGFQTGSLIRLPLNFFKPQQ